jgi:hypothetical protein
MPPGWDERYVSALGSTFDQIGGIGVSSLAARLRAAGLAPETLPGPPIMFAGMTPEEIARRGRELAMAGITGVREGPTKRDPETVALLFNTMALTVNPQHGLSRPTTFQYEFVDPDIATWHLTVDNGTAVAAEGPVAAPALRLAVAYQDYVDIIGRRLDPRRALVTGRLRIRGNPLGLKKLVQVFPQPWAGRQAHSGFSPPFTVGRERDLACYRQRCAVALVPAGERRTARARKHDRHRVFAVRGDRERG